MPFQYPSLPGLSREIQSDFASRLSDGEILRWSDMTVYSHVMAGAIYGLYQYVQYIERQLYPDTAEQQALERWASIWGITRNPAIAATGTVVLNTTIGAVIPAQSLLSDRSGRTYVIDQDYQAVSASTIVRVTSTQAGSIGNAEDGTVLNNAVSIAGVSAVASAQQITGGVDVESDDSLRSRVLLRLRSLSGAGTVKDYESWARQVPGVTRVWVQANAEGLGTVAVRFIRDLDNNIIPTAAQVELVRQHIAGYSPVTARVIVAAPESLLVDVSIRVSPDNDTVRAAIASAIAKYLPTEGAPAKIIRISRMMQAISHATGEDSHTLISPAQDIQVADHQIAQIGVITWV